MRVFLSWSGERSHCVAGVLRDWLPNVIQVVRPFLSDQDIPKGARWGTQVGAQLREADFGIFCLTADNLNAPWLLFEAGAISNRFLSSSKADQIPITRVCTYLFDVDPEDLTPPLADFQATKADLRDDTFRLVCTINDALAQNAVKPDRLRSCYDKWWPDLQDALKQIAPCDEPPRKRSAEDMFQEIVRLLRGYEKSTYDVPEPIGVIGSEYETGRSRIEYEALGKRVRRMFELLTRCDRDSDRYLKLKYELDRILDRRYQLMTTVLQTRR